MQTDINCSYLLSTHMQIDCGGFLSKGIVTGRNARKIGNKQRNFTDGLLGEALALKVHLRLHSFNSSMPFLLL
jgi:hypothetical protein